MYGMNVHKAVIAAGESESGMTVHWVTEEYDQVPLCFKRRVKYERETRQNSCGPGVGTRAYLLPTYDCGLHCNDCFLTMAIVTIYTDGGASGNPGPGGYGALLMYGEHHKELSAGYRLTTNNRMELLAVIVALGPEASRLDAGVFGFQIRGGRCRERVGQVGAKNFKDKKNPICGSVF